MKNLLLITAILVIAASCVKPIQHEEMADKWNGYSRYLKMGEQVHTLWAGKHIDVGTVTYGIDDNANFYVTYDCSASGWQICETHMFAGAKADMPLNKPGAPKIGLFPNSGCHNPRVSKYTYEVPLAQLPPAEEPGFVVASHCVVRSPAGKTETAWAEGDYTFSDKGWGWYDDFYFNPTYEPLTILYGTSCSSDSLKLFHLDITRGIVELILVEYVGNAAGLYDAAAYDPASGILLFANYSTGGLYINHLNEEGPSISAGELQGTPASATFYDEHYYYIDEELNTINKVEFTTGWIISCETVMDTVPGNITVNDMVMNPAGTNLYLLCQVNDADGHELISYNVSTGTFFSHSVSVCSGAQIAYGSDGLLYAIAPMQDGSPANWVYVIDFESGTLTVIEDEIIIIDDPFTDMASGPAM
jgi:hypothetical protein